MNPTDMKICLTATKAIITTEHIFSLPKDILPNISFVQAYTRVSAIQEDVFHFSS